MTARRSRRGALPPWAIAAGLLLVLAAITPALVRDAVLLAAAAGAAVLAWRRLSARPAAAPARELEALKRERDALAAELAQARARLAEAERRASDALEGMHAAWDAAASRPPSSPRPSAWECPRCHCLFERPGFDHEPCSDDPCRAAVLADPRSGARPLIGGSG